MAAQFEIYKDSAKEYRWRFRATNGRIVADSGEGYGSKANCQAGIDIVKKEAPGAKVEDKT